MHDHEFQETTPILDFLKRVLHIFGFHFDDSTSTVAILD